MVVLVVDDSAGVRSRLLALLGEAGGLSLREARDSAEALAVLSSVRVDVLILDLHLCGGNGLDVLAYVKAHCPGVLTLVLTNAASEQHRRECLARGADYFFDKSREFAEAVELVLARAPARRTPLS